MNYITGVAISSTVAAITSSYAVQNIINPIKNVVSYTFKDFTALNTLIYTSKTRYEKMGNSYMILCSNSNSFIQWFRTERVQELFTYLNSIIYITFHIIEKIEDCELNLEYEYIYSLSDCIVNKNDFSTDFRRLDNNSDVIVLSNLFERLDDYNIEKFLTMNKCKLFWDIKKSLFGIYTNGYVYGKINWDSICIHNNIFKLVMCDKLKYSSPTNIEYNKQYDTDWINFIMCYNTGMIHPDNKIGANLERKDLIQLLKELDEKTCIIRTVRTIENKNIQHVNCVDELKYLMNGISSEDDEDEIIMNAIECNY